jgi:hypothetical protein
MIDFQQFHKILVTGPQRSGTRIAAKIIADDISYQYVDERDFVVDNQELFDEILSSADKLVIQCPGMCHCIEQYAVSGTLIVMMIRAIPDIIASENRVEWINGPYHEYEKYGIDILKARFLRRHHNDKISVRKYQHWRTYQKGKIRHLLELEYESLSYHRLWIPKEQRLHFTAEQTE